MSFIEFLFGWEFDLQSFPKQIKNILELSAEKERSHYFFNERKLMIFQFEILNQQNAIREQNDQRTKHKLIETEFIVAVQRKDSRFVRLAKVAIDCPIETRYYHIPNGCQLERETASTK